ncbi:YdeI/OmpD-associated family protein [Marinicellulosiphila megalodicopiae]|uniref:YdeI/OmpD-associated family protein n=1 Tax=Marinicellulosiphila megalodicopiae TaxID=2724896 RepID=UPI003BB04D96
MDSIIFFKNQNEFHNWLEMHCETKEIWVGYYKKNSGQSSITWPESVDVALCFGWIDGIRKTIDDKSYKIRFTPRKIKSVWSAVNVNKVKQLIPLGKMKPEGMLVYNKRSDKQGYTSQDRNVQLSTEYESKIKSNLSAWEFFTQLAPSYKRDSIWWVMSAKRKDTQLRRLGILIESSEAGLKIPSMRKK